MSASIHLERCLIGAIGAVDLSALFSADKNPVVANIVKSSVRDAEEFIGCGEAICEQCEAELTSLFATPNLVQVGRIVYPNAHNAAIALVKDFCRISKTWAGIGPAATDLTLIETNWQQVAHGLRIAFIPEEETRGEARNLGSLLGRERYALFKLIDKPDGVFPPIMRLGA